MAVWEISGYVREQFVNLCSSEIFDCDTSAIFATVSLKNAGLTTDV